MHETLKAFNSMVSQFNPISIVTRGAAFTFEGFPVIALFIAVIMIACIIAIIFWYIIRWCTMGKFAWNKNRTLSVSDLPDKYRELVESNGNNNNNKIFRHIKDKDASCWLGTWHIISTLISVIIVVFGIYVAFQVCGIDPALLIGLGVVSFLLGWTMTDFVVSLRCGLESYWGLFEEKDVLLINGVAQEVTWMGLIGFKTLSTETKIMNMNGKEKEVHILHERYHYYSAVIRNNFTKILCGGDELVCSFDERYRITQTPYDTMKMSPSNNGPNLQSFSQFF